MTLDDQLRGRFTEEEAETIIFSWFLLYGGDKSYISKFVEMFKEKGWIEKSALEEAKERFIKHQIYDVLLDYTEELEREVERLRKEK